MANNPFYVEPANPLKALLLGEDAFNQAQQMAGRRVAEDAINNGDTRSALARLIGIGDPKSAEVLSQYSQAGNSVYGTPIYGTKPDGTPAIGSFDKSGTFRPIDTGSFTVTPGVKAIDTGTGTILVGSKSGQPIAPGTFQPGQQSAPQAQPQQGQLQSPQAQAQSPVGYYPKDVAGEAEQKTFGTQQGEKLAALGKAKSSLDTASNAFDRLSFTANRIANDPALGKITGIQGVFPNWPGGAAANVQAQLETLKSQAAFTVLQAMREASKTGGAVGQVSNFEEQMLMNNLAAIDRAQSVGEFKNAMQRIVEYAQGAKGRLKDAYDTDYGALTKPQPEQSGRAPIPMQGQQAQPVRVNSPDEARKLPSGTPIILPDGTPGRVP